MRLFEGLSVALDKCTRIPFSFLCYYILKHYYRCIYVWSIALYGLETWTLRKLEPEYLESFEMWCWRRMEKIKWPEKVTNEQVLIRIRREVDTYK